MAVPVIFILLVLGLWETLPREGIVDPTLLPPLSTIFATLSQLMQDGTLISATGVTFGEVLLAWLIAIPVGVLIGLVVASPTIASRVLGPFSRIFVSIPKSVFAPLFILSLGIGFWQKVFFGVFQAIFFIALATASAVTAVPQRLNVLGYALGASRFQRYRHIYLPAMLPYVLDALRVGLSMITTGVIFAEIYVSQRGLGHLISGWAQSFDVAKLYAGLLVVTLICVALNELLRSLERRLSVWRGT